ncbi:hypothetical protein DFH09DRAFT_1324074 [Mycena vulgaris]|nr:hypothetical protein DFH09DRAFT_1324074 [Mycena vulgaris]
MSTRNNFAASLTPAQDRALKLEAIRHKGKPVTQQLDRWMTSYIPGPPAGPPRESYYERKRAELVAKKKRVDALMELRARVLRDPGARRGPRLRQARERIQQQHAAELKQQAEVRKAEHAAIEARAERAAAEARVAFLMALRVGTGKGGRK